MELLNIRTQHPQIGIRSDLAKITVKTPPIGLELKNSAVEVDVHTTPDVWEIDQYPSRASCGLLSIADTIARWANEGEQKAAEGISRRIREGEAFTENAKRGNVIARQAALNLREMPEMKIGLTIVTPPTINYTQGELNIKVNIRPVSLKINEQPVTVENTEPKVDIYLRQEGNIHMWVSKDKYDIYA